MRRLAFALLAVVALAAVPSATAATPVTGTVTVENGTADGARVTVVPVTAALERAGHPARTTVDEGTFAVDVTEAPRYAVRVSHGDATHHELLRNATRAEFHLSASVGARVVDADGGPVAGTPVELVDRDGFVVATAETDANGTVSFGPVERDETYRLRATVDGVPYRRSVDRPRTGPRRCPSGRRPPTPRSCGFQPGRGRGTSSRSWRRGTPPARRA